MLRSTLILIAATTVSALELGCFSDTSETLSSFVNNGSYTFQSTGYCQQVCGTIGHSYYALKGSDCWCGDAIPPISDMVDDSNCNIPCAGYARQNCGGINAFEVYLSGDTTAIESIVSAYSAAATASATVAASDSTAILSTATAASSESFSVSSSAASTTSAAILPTATTTKVSSSAVIIPSATSTSTSVPTGAAVAVNVQIGFGLMAGLMALTSSL
ncbi:uncharacterized protein BHQ10_008907 [Talaromyces amestolkiae]|uniref:WSC domain-containing protein n=1 Tax=Talaromyces amestolkiae TaxID=1196081 RepID=A0A364LAN8_TALAM|nr:uncharacterized protein BHQ10_008907 [Talaromyces amestolkiae]RAO72895.1 hypothetical protein BHQ10_008907 [Talaromyces amestolkiae]